MVRLFDPPAIIEFGHFSILPHRRQLLAQGRPIRLGGRAFDLLLALITASPAVVSKNELVRRVWQLRIVDENWESDTRLLRCARLLRRLRHSDRNDAARPPTASRDEGWTERCAPSEARSLRQPEDELPADGTKLLERVGAWLKQRARMKPDGKSFFNGTSWIGL